jgi:hypothetical protein
VRSSLCLLCCNCELKFDVLKLKCLVLRRGEVKKFAVGKGIGEDC